MIDRANSASFTALKIAIKDSKISVVRELIAAGADVNDTTTGTLSPFLAAIAFKEKRISTLFLSSGKHDLKNVVVDGVNRNFLSLCMRYLNRVELVNIMTAISEHFLLHQNLAQFMVVLLAQNRQDFIKAVQLMMKEVKMPLVLNSFAEFAVRKDYPQVIKILHDEGHDLGFNLGPEDGLGIKLTHFSIYNGNLELTRLLLDLGADVNVVTSKSYSLIHLAGFIKRIDLIVEFIQKGAKPGLLKLLNATYVAKKTDKPLRIIRGSPFDFNTMLFENGQDIFTAAVSQNAPEIFECFCE